MFLITCRCTVTAYTRGLVRQQQRLGSPQIRLGSVEERLDVDERVPVAREVVANRVEVHDLTSE